MFSEHPEVLAAVGGGDHPGGRRFGLIYRWPLALPYPVASGVMVLQAEQIIRELNNGAQTVQQLLARPETASHARVASRDIRVAEWTFETPGVKLSD